MKNLNTKRIVNTFAVALAASAVLPVVASATEYVDYTVVKGDNLWNLAITYNTSVAEIAQANNIKNTRLIYVNQQLRIPVNTNVATTVPEASTPSVDTSTGDYYYVLKGDTLTKIAAKYGVTVADLAYWNNIPNIHFIREGALLKVGSSDGSSSNNQTATQYVVVKGDTLSHIALHYKTTVAQLVAWNNISDPHWIYVGDVLQVTSGNARSVDLPEDPSINGDIEAKERTSEEIAEAMAAFEAGESLQVEETVEEIFEVVEETIEAVEETIEAVEETIEVVEETIEVVEDATAIPGLEIAVESTMIEDEECPDAIQAEEYFAVVEDVQLEEDELLVEIAEETVEEVEATKIQEFLVGSDSTAFDIAAMFNVTVGELLQWNNIEDTSFVAAGTLIFIHT